VKTVGLTGGIGSGKSTAARILGDLGAHVIDADRVGHEVYRPGSQGWQRVVECFGRDVVGDDGEIDRKRLGAIVFADPRRLAQLNALIHPLIREEIRRSIEERRAAGSSTPVIVEAAVLIEAKWFTLVDEVWLIVADRDAVYRRVAAQRGLGREAIDARIGSQSSDEERRRHAAVVIDNSGGEAALRAELTRLWRERLEARDAGPSGAP
jgi:dephospho-CoA kinase